jgi:hypothetical protein
MADLSCGPRSFWCNKNTVTDSEFPLALGVRLSVLELFLETVFIIEIQMRPLAE